MMQPEDYYDVKITKEFISIEHPKFGKEQILWKEITSIQIITTDEGPFLPDVWINLIGKERNCKIPQGAVGYDEVYDRVSKYPGFNFENVVRAMSSTDNKEFLVWEKTAN